MSDDAALQKKLKESQQSRIRAWEALKGLREIISALGDDPLPAPSKPPSFETEGELLKKNLLKTLAHLRRDLETVQGAVERARSFMTAKEGHGSYPDAIIQLNRAVLKVGEWTGTLEFTEKKCRRDRRAL